jgi:hypothetical protein
MGILLTFKQRASRPISVSTKQAPILAKKNKFGVICARRWKAAHKFAEALVSEAADYLAAWDGQAWLSIGGGTDFIVNALAAVKDSPADTTRQALFVGGMFGQTGGISSRRIGRWGCDPTRPPRVPRIRMKTA